MIAREQLPGLSWVRVTRNAACPICDKPDWCSVGVRPDGTHAVALCMRVESNRPSTGDAGGHLHQLDGEHRERVRVPESKPKPPRCDIETIARRAFERATDGDRFRLATDLGVTVDALTLLRVGLHDGAWSFPMRNGLGEVVGVRLRKGARKFAVTGSREGLFMAPTAMHAGSGPLLFVEGPTDCAALLPWFDTIGRPSALGGVEHCKRIAADRLVAVFADRDGAGRSGAKVLAAVLAKQARAACVVSTPRGTKDPREWVRAGATRRDVLDLIHRCGEPVYRTDPLPDDHTPDEAEERAVREYREDDDEWCQWREVQP